MRSLGSSFIRRRRGSSVRRQVGRFACRDPAAGGGDVQPRHSAQRLGRALAQPGDVPERELVAVHEGVDASGGVAPGASANIARRASGPQSAIVRPGRLRCRWRATSMNVGNDQTCAARPTTSASTVSASATHASRSPRLRIDHVDRHAGEVRIGEQGGLDTTDLRLDGDPPPSGMVGSIASSATRRSPGIHESLPGVSPVGGVRSRSLSACAPPPRCPPPGRFLAPGVAPSARSCIRRAVGLALPLGGRGGTNVRSQTAADRRAAHGGVVAGAAHRGERSGVSGRFVTLCTPEVACAALARGGSGTSSASTLSAWEEGALPWRATPLLKKAEGSHVGKHVILVAEDDVDTATMLEELLTPEGSRSELTATRARCSMRLRSGRFHAVLLDLTMPGMTTDRFVSEIEGLGTPSPPHDLLGPPPPRDAGDRRAAACGRAHPEAGGHRRPAGHPLEGGARLARLARLNRYRPLTLPVRPRRERLGPSFRRTPGCCAPRRRW